jgi:hypothetical protein
VGFLLLAALVLGGVSWRLFQRSTPEQARPAFVGDVILLASEPASEGIISAHHSTDAVDESDANENTLELEVDIRPARRVRTVWFAVVLTGAARLALDSLEPSGSVPFDIDRPQGGIGFAGAADRVFYLSGVNWPVDYKPGSGSTVVFGQFSGGRIDKALYAILTIPMTGGMVVDHSETWALSTPRLGKSDTRGAADLSRVQDPRAIDPNLVAEVASHQWQQPARVDAEFTGYEDGLNDSSSFQQAGAQPAEPFGTEWRASGSLKVDAVFTRPGVQTQQERDQFIAGVSVSLAAGLLVWALELLSVERRGRQRIGRGA